MSDIDTKTGNAVAPANAQSDKQEKQLSPLEVVDAKAEEAYKTLKATGSMPEGLPPELELVVTAKKRQRDTQASYTESQQRLKASQAESNALRSLALESDTVSLTEDQQAELEDLKYQDPEAWRLKVNEYETVSKTKRIDLVKEKVQASSKEAIEQERLEQLKIFTSDTGIELTDDVIDNDIPPRITNKLISGEISFQEFLSEAGEFLGSEKVIANSGEDASLKKVASFDDVTGSSTSENVQTQTDFATQYARGELEM